MPRKNDTPSDLPQFQCRRCGELTFGLCDHCGHACCENCYTHTGADLNVQIRCGDRCQPTRRRGYKNPYAALSPAPA